MYGYQYNWIQPWWYPHNWYLRGRVTPGPYPTVAISLRLIFEGSGNSLPLSSHTDNSTEGLFSHGHMPSTEKAKRGHMTPVDILEGGVCFAHPLCNRQDIVSVQLWWYHHNWIMQKQTQFVVCWDSTCVRYWCRGFPCQAEKRCSDVVKVQLYTYVYDRGVWISTCPIMGSREFPHPPPWIRQGELSGKIGWLRVS